MELFKEFTFDAAHWLPHVPEDHKCRRIHGHTYRLRVCVEGPLDPRLGWVMDFADLKKVVDPLVKQLDHQLLNELEGLDNPTCERIAVWLWDRIKPRVPQLAKIILNETPTSGVVWTGA
ncbi:MAG: 6-carboxytetrahydropterin synthase QueD [Saprospiraceae bacterium]|nr:6-carboxytetrahydropterin synthase QueD [Saprospiraceae bacterium]